MADHTIRSFDEDINTLRDRVLGMGAIAEQMTTEAMDALRFQDLDLSQRVIISDAQLDNLQREVEDLTIATIARRQPVAIDLREMIVAIRIANDLERIGDLAKSIAKRVLEISPDAPTSRLILSLGSLNALAQKQLKDVLDAYREGDAQKAGDVWTRDANVDALYNSLFRELLTHMMEDVRRISICTDLLFCAKNIERVGDHTTNIAEAVFYLVTGQTLGLDRPKIPSETHRSSALA